MPFTCRLPLPVLLLATALAGQAHAAPAPPPPPPPYDIVTTDLPPFSQENGPIAPGALAEMVKELSIRTGTPEPIQFFPWPRAIAMTQNRPRTLILPLTRTPEREPLFRWLVKLYRQNFVFIARKGSGLNLHSLEALREQRIVVLRGSPNLKQLQDRQFTRIVEANTVEDMARMLQRGMVDAIYGGDAINLYTIRSLDMPVAHFEVGMTLDTGDVWLAGSRDLTDADTAAWREAMRRLVRDGGYARILKKYQLPE